MEYLNENGFDTWDLICPTYKMTDISSECKDFSEKIIIHGPDYEWWNLPHHWHY